MLAAFDGFDSWDVGWSGVVWKSVKVADGWRLCTSL
jgi:hypothetical protein